MHARYSRCALITQARTNVTAFPVGETKVPILVLILTSVLKDLTAVHQTQGVLTCKARTNAIAILVTHPPSRQQRAKILMNVQQEVIRAPKTAIV